MQEFAREPFEVPLNEGDVDGAFKDAEVISGEYSGSLSRACDHGTDECHRSIQGR